MNSGQLSKVTGVSQRMIRHYEAIGLMPPPNRRDNGYRDYSPRSVERLRFIANARDLGFSVNEIAALLGLWDDRERASGEVKAIALGHAEDLARKAEALEAMRLTLLELAEGCNGDSRPDCPILAGLAETRQRPARELTRARHKPKEIL
ncbi:Cu(I)-responsive transcriptional regulator [Sphingobium phenoxybenzoativorans]|jgi:MerR family copper efflux transcriptional regulator|uniref:Cu(I)-responsive transcriptional regulator n=1 Tax=Sphingobium phenoxybenzoativorans TaxID=1592790 RepID=A0A975Q3L7_9SPHN|nr:MULTISPECIES: Cu(I)-responsive transcriptional regulator [Sphingobium]QUT07662.1 Cu(I)-responsive transcriptional regulator [Sphingobium phenoxybenzoativorans]